MCVCMEGRLSVLGITQNCSLHVCVYGNRLSVLGITQAHRTVAYMCVFMGGRVGRMEDILGTHNLYKREEIISN